MFATDVWLDFIITSKNGIDDEAVIVLHMSDNTHFGFYHPISIEQAEKLVKLLKIEIKRCKKINEREL